MEISFVGKRALVTGASRGIGFGIAKALAKSGAHVYALARNVATLTNLEGITPVECDLLNWEQTRACLEKLETVSLLVNNAGIGVLEPFLEISQDTFDKTINCNVKAVLNVSQIVAKGMISNQVPGTIVNVSSHAGLRAIQDHTSYSASKAALDAVTRSMALELAVYNIRVNSVNPTVVLTDLGKMAWSDPVKGEPMLARIPLKKFVEIEDVVNMVLFLLSDKANMTTGAAIPIEGGLLML